MVRECFHFRHSTNALCKSHLAPNQQVAQRCLLAELLDSVTLWKRNNWTALLVLVAWILSISRKHRKLPSTSSASTKARGKCTKQPVCRQDLRGGCWPHRPAMLASPSLPAGTASEFPKKKELYWVWYQRKRSMQSQNKDTSSVEKWPLDPFCGVSWHYTSLPPPDLFAELTGSAFEELSILSM